MGKLYKKVVDNQTIKWYNTIVTNKHKKTFSKNFQKSVDKWKAKCYNEITIKKGQPIKMGCKGKKQW